MAKRQTGHGADFSPLLSGEGLLVNVFHAVSYPSTMCWCVHKSMTLLTLFTLIHDKLLQSHYLTATHTRLFSSPMHHVSHISCTVLFQFVKIIQQSGPISFQFGRNYIYILRVHTLFEYESCWFEEYHIEEWSQSSWMGVSSQTTQ